MPNLALWQITMIPTEVITFDSDDQLAKAVASRWLSNLANAPKHQPYCTALSGGRIARQFFSEVAAQKATGGSLLSPVHFFWADERCVAPDDPESNFALANQLLFQPCQIAGPQIHRIHGELAPGEAAAAAEAELRRIAPRNRLDKPIFDLVLLGMGEDGHIASIFPYAPTEVMDGPSVYCPVSSPKPPPKRITLSLPVMVEAHQVWVLVAGPGKEEALRNSLAASGTTPLGQLLRNRQQTLVFSSSRTVLR